MSFVQNNLAQVAQQAVGGFDIYTYTAPDGDTIDDCLSPGYFARSRYISSPDWLGSVIQLRAGEKYAIVEVVANGGTVSLLSGNNIGKKRIYVTSADQLATIVQGFEYLIDGQVDMGSMSIEVPSAGLTIGGYGFGVSQLYSTEPGYQMFTGANAGDVFINGVEISVSGAGSGVFALTNATGLSAVELVRVNFNNCSSLGYLSGYRQFLEDNTGRFGGSPELEFIGSMDGARIDTSIIRNATVTSAIYKAGAGLSFSGRFVIDQNVNLPASGAWINFSSSNFVNDESFIIQNSYITRLGVLNPADTTILPNINQDSIKSNWLSNTGIKNTQDYIRASTTVEVPTVIASAGVYYPMLGTWTVGNAVHMDMPSNGQFRLLAGAGNYLVIGDISVEGTANDLIDMRVMKSVDGGATFPTQVNHVRRVINAFTGSRDVAFFTLTFDVSLEPGDRIRIEIENVTAARNVTAEIDSYIVINEI